ncbi:platelet-activating factor acetylhydrolase-like [Rhopalosiphum padi]|uniref:platelet-activating factor acetylhydrolase-like n=1 Tax=Rhopalosiphum padi TaxID=40932 RepID=UPI00298EBBF2|nr:platelet-activating factor acetylhydrolase-like [Rhopalosiphum padi]
MNNERSKKLHIPYPTGPYATGCMELMTEYSEEGCFARVFYPTNIPSDQLDKYSDKWIPWVPNEIYMKQFANALHVPYFIFKYFPPILGQAPYYIPTISDAPISDKEESYPFVLFSHGYAATRFVCSHFCNTLASYGFIVAAIEHRDKSSPVTFYYDSPKSAEQDKPTWIHYRHFHKTYNSDTYTMTNNQMKFRHKECTKLLNTFLDINAGVSVKNVLKSSFDLNQFNRKINVNKIISSGFSFGGATAIYNISHDSRYRVAIILDGWIFPLKSEPFLNIEEPILFVNTHTFQIPANLNLICQYLHSKGIRKLYTLKKTTHESLTDTAFMHGYWLDLKMLKKLNAKTALNLQSSLVVQFLHNTIGCPTNSENTQIFIEEHSDNLVEDIISYTKRVKRKLTVFPW